MCRSVLPQSFMNVLDLLSKLFLFLFLGGTNIYSSNMNRVCACPLPNPLSFFWTAKVEEVFSSVWCVRIKQRTTPLIIPSWRPFHPFNWLSTVELAKVYLSPTDIYAQTRWYRKKKLFHHQWRALLSALTYKHIPLFRLSLFCINGSVGERGYIHLKASWLDEEQVMKL